MFSVISSGQLEPPMRCVAVDYQRQSAPHSGFPIRTTTPSACLQLEAGYRRIDSGDHVGSKSVGSPCAIALCLPDDVVLKIVLR